MTANKVANLSYLIFAVIFFMVWAFGLGAFFVAIYFSYLALKVFTIRGKKLPAILIFVVFVTFIFYAFVLFIREALAIFPNLAATVVPKVVHTAHEWGFDLPFSDLDSLKAVTVEGIREELKGLAKFAQIATKEFVLLLISLVIAIGVFVNDKIDLGEGGYRIHNNLYSLLSRELRQRFSTFYQSFSTVMGAQIIISAINTACTAIFLLIIGLPYAQLVVAVTFIAGLLPIVGNLISNTVIVGIASTLSIEMAIVALIFLVALHKGEYFLNSRIIGGRIKNPMWLTLIGLVVGETMMGIPGMILAPVILHFMKLEMSRIEVIS